MKRLFLSSMLVLGLTACADNDNSAQTEALEARIVELESQINGKSFGACEDANFYSNTEAYAASMGGLPSTELESADWHKALGEFDDVLTTQSGLQYRVIQAGKDDGPKPKSTDFVTVHYHGTFLDGRVFDSSYDREKTNEFGADKVITGWTEALTDMTLCEARTLYIPGKLAYGARGRPGSIPPNATLVFNVQLKSFREPGMVDENKALKDRADGLEQFALRVQQQLIQLQNRATAKPE